jgi:hypothetical protein
MITILKKLFKENSLHCAGRLLNTWGLAGLFKPFCKEFI